MTETAPIEIPPNPPFSKGGDASPNPPFSKGGAEGSGYPPLQKGGANAVSGGILSTPADISDQIIDFTLALQDYLANDPDRRATDLLATAVDIMDALLAGEEDVGDRVLF